MLSLVGELKLSFRLLRFKELLIEIRARRDRPLFGSFFSAVEGLLLFVPCGGGGDWFALLLVIVVLCREEGMMVLNNQSINAGFLATVRLCVRLIEKLNPGDN